MRLSPPRLEDAEALTDLHLDVEEAYAHLMPASVFAERRAGRDQRVERWRDIVAAGSSDNLLAWSTEGRLLGFSSTGPGRDSPDDRLPPLELMGLYVRAEVYGHGVGRALCAAAIGTAPAYLSEPIWIAQQFSMAALVASAAPDGAISVVVGAADSPNGLAAAMASGAATLAVPNDAVLPDAARRTSGAADERAARVRG